MLISSLCTRIPCLERLSYFLLDPSGLRQDSPPRNRILLAELGCPWAPVGLAPLRDSVRPGPSSLPQQGPPCTHPISNCSS